MNQRPPVGEASATPSMPAPAALVAAGPRKPIDSRTLFAGAGEVQISHRGVLYRLKQTALGKLILTK